MGENDVLNDLSRIRSLMEKSTRFISISGNSGILVGVYALLVSGYLISEYGTAVDVSGGIAKPALLALGLLLASVVTGLVLARNKARRSRQPVWNVTSRSLLNAIVMPLAAGGIFAAGLAAQEVYFAIIPVFLIFYGMALFSGSFYTFREIRYIGVLEVVLGLLALWFPEYGLLFFATGFGVLHIIYGIVINKKYGA